MTYKVQLISESYYIEPSLACNYTYPIYLAPNGIPFDNKSIGEVKFQSKLILIEQHSKCIY